MTRTPSSLSTKRFSSLTPVAICRISLDFHLCPPVPLPTAVHLQYSQGPSSPTSCFNRTRIHLQATRFLLGFQRQLSASRFPPPLNRRHFSEISFALIARWKAGQREGTPRVVVPSLRCTVSYNMASCSMPLFCGPVRCSGLFRDWWGLCLRQT